MQDIQMVWRELSTNWLALLMLIPFAVVAGCCLLGMATAISSSRRERAFRASERAARRPLLAWQRRVDREDSVLYGDFRPEAELKREVR
jgi:hypothetical protein